MTPVTGYRLVGSGTLTAVKITKVNLSYHKPSHGRKMIVKTSDDRSRFTLWNAELISVSNIL